MLRGLAMLAGILVWMPSPTEACIRGMDDAYYDESRDISAARRLFSEGHLRRSFRVAGRAWSRARGRRDEDPPRHQRLKRRAMLVLASVTIRLDGNVDLRRWRTPDGLSKAQRTENMLWAIEQLEEIGGDDDPEITARIGEAYQHLANRQRDAIRVLEPLAQADLMPDVYGYAALARAYRMVGNDEGRDLAASVCRRRASRAQQGICPA